MFEETEETNRICNNAIAEVLNVIGFKWAFLVIGHLSYGAQRFNQLRRSLNNVSTQSLTVILRNLEEQGVVRREVFATVPVTVEYSLTDKGKDFVNVLKEMHRWGLAWKERPDDAEPDEKLLKEASI
ncbi:hypothetical protein B1A99_34045 [Cohnella sp. CIP 111063]|jgi:DNA-binding HxlR family transcriptional regulator|uniref:winged helix-turn-helix transcriptional regulator n=1 Tax=unclassified Cohnella TaxID=2636738 RepID=UPI000B8C3C75|nr:MULTISPECIES: helix-turn-helix domain-containing protein [unclassified Cohnella]OXS52485.1 hypothetical protein B1A99_34045 [Cohnella sp. CIP 111063]PRX58538.1 HxlR family transcriptional regulator [Cohnella sp. SGD-V74]